MGLYVKPFYAPLLLCVYEAIFLPKHGCHFNQLLIKAKVLNILIYCYYLFGTRSNRLLLVWEGGLA